jgi:regulator of protease activity HflC (stomatin/prohibitin superfamily)
VWRIAPWNRGRDHIEVFSTLNTLFNHPMLEALLAQDEALAAQGLSPRGGALRDHLMVIANNDTERTLVWRDDRLAFVLGPGRFAFWTVPHRLAVERFDARAFSFEHPGLQTILAHPEATKWLDGVAVPNNEDVLLYRDGVLVSALGPGLHVFWKGTGKTAWKAVDRREQVADVAGQEIITADKVTLRVNLVVTWQVADPVKAVTASADHAQALYREAQLALRAAVGTRLLDALLADKQSVGAEVLEALTARVAELGVAVKSVGLRDIILPGDMKALLNQVMAAQKEAEANLIRRREETAAARSQANTAKLLAENPMLARLKEMELLKEVLAGAKATFVFGNGDVAEQVRSLVTSKDQD